MESHMYYQWLFFFSHKEQVSITALEHNLGRPNMMLWSDQKTKVNTTKIHLSMFDLQKMDVLPVWLHYTNRALLEDVIKWSL